MARQNRAWPAARPPEGRFALNAASPQAGGLVAWYPALLSRGGRPLREPVRGLEAVFVGAPAWYGSPRLGWAVNFDGSADSLEVAGLAPFAFVHATGRFTLFARLKLDVISSSTDQTLAGNTPTSTERGFMFSYAGGAAKKLFLYFSNGSGTGQAFSSDANAIADTDEHDVAVSGAGSGAAVRFYVDGRFVGGTTALGALGSGDATRALRLGVCNAATPVYYLDGLIGELRVYDRPLSDAQIAALSHPPTRWELYRPAKRRPVLRPVTPLNAGATLEGGADVAVALPTARTLKHVDFEVPAWGELAGEPASDGQAASVSQAAAAFPDRPRDRAGAGLHVVLAQGAGSAYVEHELRDAEPILHVRVLVHVGTLAGGEVTILRGLDGQSAATFDVVLDAAAHEVRVTAGAGTTLAAALPAASGPRWLCIEVALDAEDQRAELWLNGQPADSAAGLVGLEAVRTLRLGALEKDPAATGELFLDEWIMATGYIGPVRVPPAGAHSDEPARWLVVYHAADADSAAWAESYRAARRVPHANLLGLALPAVETIEQAQLDALAEAIDAYLARHAPAGEVLGVLLGHGVPGYFSEGGGVRAVASALARPDGAPASNPLAIDGVPTRPTAANTGGLRLTARIDAPTLAAAEALTGRALALEAAGLGDGDGAAIWLSRGEAGAPADALAAWAASLSAMRTRLPLEQTAAPEGFEAVNRDGFCWGAVAAAPPPDYFAAPPGRRVCCFPLRSDAATAPSLRSGAPGNWAETALEAGYAAVAGTAGPLLDAEAPLVRPFFEALRRGWALGEAWFVASPSPHAGAFLIGDPLLKPALPPRGWDVYGPLADAAQLAHAEPILALRESERQAAIPPEHRPAPGQPALYALRHVGAAPADEAPAAAALLRLVSAAQGADNEPLGPAWPDHEGWPLAGREGQLALIAAWERPIRQAGIARVDLEIETAGGMADVAHAEPALQDHVVELHVAVPPQPARYRWRYTSPAGVARTTPWSAVFTPPAAATVALQTL